MLDNHSDRLEPRRDVDCQVMKPNISADDLRLVVSELVAAAALAGLVITVEQRPLRPLAMGHYENFVSVRPARGGA